jgi:hypothetical protein
MRARAIALLAGAAATAFLPPAHAEPDPRGYVCTAQEQPTGANGALEQYLGGGPLVLQDSVSHAPLSGTLVCRLQRDVSDYTGTGPSVSAHGAGVVAVLPTKVATVASPAYLCSEYHDDASGVTYYFDDATLTWWTSPSARCGLAF